MTSVSAILDTAPLVDSWISTKSLPGSPYPAEHPLARQQVLNARAVIVELPGYQATALKTLEIAAQDAGIGTLYYKDESTRFGLGSFKALGGAYAVLQLVRAKGNGVTVCSATEGNHGRAVSFGAQLAGVPCQIFVSESVSEGRAQAMRALGAEVTRVTGNYEASLDAAIRAARASGWHIVSDTGFSGYEEIPLMIMQGYGVLVEELAEQVPGGVASLTHVFLQAGCGGFAAATIAGILNHAGAKRPKFVLVEPEEVACALASLGANEMKVIRGDYITSMGGLACGEVSTVAWPILRDYCDAALAIADRSVAPAMLALAEGTLGGGSTVAGESGVAGLIGALVSASRRDLRQALSIDRTSKILVIGTEGATDPVTYERLIGLGVISTSS